jgi:hypothetical protein
MKAEFTAKTEKNTADGLASVSFRPSMRANLFPSLVSTRRDWIKGIGAGALAALGSAPGRAAEPVETGAARNLAPPATADCVILLWMAGGMAHTETFDPKHYEPFSPGIESKRVLSTFPAIRTSVDHIRISQGLEHIAGVMHEGAILRTYTVPIVEKITHARYQYVWHTGYMPPLPVAAPHIGAVIARTLGPRNPDIPAFIDLAEPLEEAGREASGIQSFLTGGFLGAEYGPLMIPNPATAADDMRARVGEGRLRNRMAAWKALVDSSPMADRAAAGQKESLLRAFDQGYRLMHSPAAKAFDLSLEKPETRQVYDTGRFGQGCLLARRLVEAGARFIEVHTPYKPFGYWDTHDNGHSRTVELKRLIDRPIAQLVRELRERGLLDRTLIVLASEFSRDVLIEGRVDLRARVGRAAIASTMPSIEHYGMHAHFADAGSIVLFGGGIKRGFIYGRTADEHPCRAIEDPVTIEDVHATIYRALGIPPTLSYETERRPFYVTRDGKGKPIGALFG